MRCTLNTEMADFLGGCAAADQQLEAESQRSLILHHVHDPEVHHFIECPGRRFFPIQDHLGSFNGGVVHRHDTNLDQ